MARVDLEYPSADSMSSKRPGRVKRIRGTAAGHFQTDEMAEYDPDLPGGVRRYIPQTVRRTL